MPKIDSWDNFPAGVRTHLIDRMHDRAVTIADLNQLQVLFDLLAIPALPGYRPHAFTAVGVVVSSNGELARYPVHAQLVGAYVSEKSEVRAAITILHRWLHASERPSRPRGSTQ